jgi:hypothetical protein
MSNDFGFGVAKLEITREQKYLKPHRECNAVTSWKIINLKLKFPTTTTKKMIWNLTPLIQARN